MTSHETPPLPDGQGRCFKKADMGMPTVGLMHFHTGSKYAETGWLLKTEQPEVYASGNARFMASDIAPLSRSSLPSLLVMISTCSA